MSGEPVVVLGGRSMARLVSAVQVVAEQTGRPVTLVGGLAVMCRLLTPYRVTTDLDTVDRRALHEQPQLELLVSAGATPSGPSGALVRTRLGDVQVDVLQVTDADVADLPGDPTGRLHVQSHAWAAATATSLVLVADDLPPTTVAVAGAGPIVAMKLQSIMDRSAAKEATDLLDIVRLTLDRRCGHISREQLAGADRRLRMDAALHARLWFQEKADRSVHRIRSVPEGRDIELDDVHLVGDLLIAALAD